MNKIFVFWNKIKKPNHKKGDLILLINVNKRQVRKSVGY